MAMKMTRMKKPDEIRPKRREVDAYRTVETEVRLGAFTQGKLAGVQQALWWVCGIGMDPVEATLGKRDREELKAALERARNGEIEVTIRLPRGVA